jgi:hypothetical protein
LEQVKQGMIILSNRVSEVESENLFLKTLLNEGKSYEARHSPNDALHVGLLDLKNKHDEI